MCRRACVSECAFVRASSYMKVRVRESMLMHAWVRAYVRTRVITCMLAYTSTPRLLCAMFAEILMISAGRPSLIPQSVDNDYTSLRKPQAERLARFMIEQTRTIVARGSSGKFYGTATDNSSRSHESV